MKRFFLKISKWVENSLVLDSIKRGFILAIPIILVGSIAVLLLNIPIDGYRDWLQALWGGKIWNIFFSIYDATSGFMSAFLLMSISYYYSEHFAKGEMMYRILAMFTSLACFIVSFGGSPGSFSLSSFAMAGIFTAIFTAIISTRIFFLVVNKLSFEERVSAAGADVHYRRSIRALLPTVVSMLCFALIYLFLVYVLGVESINHLVQNALAAFFGLFESAFVNGLFYTFFLNLLWALGIHGGNALDPVAQTAFTADNAIISKSFLDTFTAMGGSGMALCLLLALFISARSRNNRQLATSVSPLILFNINEGLVYGMPIVYNPLMIIPFIFSPIISLLISYFAVVIGFMPAVTNPIAWTAPPIWSGYAATGSWTGAFVQVICILVSTACYIPFVKLMEESQKKQAISMINKFTDSFKADEQRGIVGEYLVGQSNINSAAKTIVSQLRADIESGNITMYYQPQMDRDGRCVSAEALLRWRFNDEMMYPPLVIALATEARCMNDLTMVILDRVCADTQILKRRYMSEFIVSVNISAEQLDNREFIDAVIAKVAENNLLNNIILEVTEEHSLSALTNIGAHIELLGKNGISMAIDDFSMGHTSLDYLKTNQFRHVKLDGSLVRQLPTNPRCYEIASSMVQLGQTLSFDVVAEYVETEELRDILLEMGCRYFQGYLYSPAIPIASLIEYCVENKRQLSTFSARVKS